jgi:hypothetical protein
MARRPTVKQKDMCGLAIQHAGWEMQGTVFTHIIKLVLVTLSAHAPWVNGTDLNVRTICYDGLIPLHAAPGGQ